jgi:ABC-2 type transport system permease protein
MSFQVLFLVANYYKKAVFRNKAIVILAFFLITLLSYATFLGWSNYVTQNEISEKYQHQSHEDWLKNPDKNPHRMAHYGNFAFRESSPLSMMEFGMESYFGNAIFLEAHKQNTANFSEASFSNSLLRFGEISIAMIFQILLPLLLFFIGYDAISAERENGTLKLHLSQGISWKTLLAGKMIGIAGVVMLFFIPAMLVIVFIWMFLQNFTITADDGLKMTFFVLFHLLYILFFCVIVVLVSAVSKTSKKALVSLIGLWLLCTIILPRGTQALGSYLYATPSKINFNSAIEKDILKVGDSHNPDDLHFKGIKDSLLTVYKIKSVDELPFNYKGFIMLEGEKISSRIYNQHLDALLETYDKQNRFSRAVSFLNPYIAIKNIAMGLSNTDYDSYVTFQKQAEAYRYSMAQKMNALQIRHISNKKQNPADKPYVIDKKHWAEVAEFHYTPPTVFQVLKNEMSAIAALLLWLVILYMLLVVASKKLKAI